MEFSSTRSLSVVVPAYNEEANLAPTIERIVEAATSVGSEFEVIIVNDCSKDRTAEVADELSRKFPEVRVVHNPVNLGFGGAYKRGVEDTRLAYTVMIPGDDAYPLEALKAIFSKVGTADVVVSYTVNMEIRKPFRRFLSRAFVHGMNFLFGLKMHYFNGVSVLPSKNARELRSSDSFGYAAENLVRLTKIHGFSYCQVPVSITERKSGKSKAFSPKNIFLLLVGIGDLFIDVYWRHPRSLKAAQTSERRA